MTNKVSAAQRRANDKWDKANPESGKYRRYKSNAKAFILGCESKDVETVEEWLNERRTNGKKIDGPLS